MKFKTTIIITAELETQLSDYENCKTPEEAIAYEKKAIEEDPMIAIEGGNVEEIKVELIER